MVFAEILALLASQGVEFHQKEGLKAWNGEEGWSAEFLQGLGFRVATLEDATNVSLPVNSDSSNFNH